VWLDWSPPKQGGGILSHGKRGGTEAFPSKEAWSRATIFVAALEPSVEGGGVQSHRMHDGAIALPSREVGFGA
jgi:hypothetical protein